MKKESFKHFVILMAVCLLSVGFTSCDDDDDDEPGSGATESIVGTWKGYNNVQGPNSMNSQYGVPMTARFYEDGTCEIWWYQNPLITDYYFTGDYTLTKKQLHLEGMYGDNGDRPFIEYDKSVNYSLKNGTLKFRFDLADWTLIKQE